MKRIIAVICLVLFAFSFNEAYAQGKNQAPANQQAAQQKPIIIKPSMPADYLVFAVNALATIEISGSEVDNFLVCKNFLENVIKTAANEGKKTEDVITFNIQLDVAQATVNFLGRAKLTGAQAPKYKAFINALTEAAKNYKPDEKSDKE
jgi:hypothetical protein